MSLATQPPQRASSSFACSSSSARLCLRPAAPCGLQKRGLARCVVRCDAESSKESGKFDPRAFRRSLNSSGKYTRRVADDEGALKQMNDEGMAPGELIAQMREEGFMHKRGDVTVKLAKSYGFCWGVERAVQMAYEARKRHPEEKLWITNEIIHNPTVNKRLKEMEIEFIEDTDGTGKDFTGVEDGDVVILPAFGAAVEEMKLLNDKGATIVDTTCPWVSKVWNAVDMHTRKDYTSVIHGKWAHEETVATASFASTYLIVKDLKEADYVREYILADDEKRASMRPEFMEKFKNAMSKGFDPDKDLVAVGIANQTTMLKGDTKALGQLVQNTMIEKYGPENVNDHFMVLDTICDATQERQDAMFELVGQDTEEEKRSHLPKDVDMIIVVGGYNSSNTQHLQEISEHNNIPSFWVDTKDRIDLANNKLDHLMSWGELQTTENWLPEGPVRIGVTSGASTPDKVVEDVLDVVFAIKEAQMQAA